MIRRSFIVGALVLAPSVAAAHPYHTSSAVLDVRGDRVEITLTVTPEDLQEALRREADRRLDIDTDAEVDALARTYVASRFVLAGDDGPLSMTWVGSEVEDDAARLYFEFRLPKDRHAVTLRSAVFFELAPAQVNRVLVRHGTTRRTLRFRTADPARPLFRRSSKGRKKPLSRP